MTQGYSKLTKRPSEELLVLLESPFTLDHQQAMTLLNKFHIQDVTVKSGMHEVVRYAFDRNRTCHLALVHKFPRDGAALVTALVERFVAKKVPVLLVNSAETVNYLKPFNKKGRKPGSTCCIITAICGSSLKELHRFLVSKKLDEPVGPE